MTSPNGLGFCFRKTRPVTFPDFCWCSTLCLIILQWWRHKHDNLPCTYTPTGDLSVTYDVTVQMSLVTSLVTKKKFWILFPKITVGDIPEILSIKVKHQNDHYTKMTVLLYEMTVIFPFWTTVIFRKKYDQIDRYLKPKWPLFKSKWPLYVERKFTVILVEKTVQNNRYLYQNDHDIYKRNWWSFWRYSDVGDIVLLVTIFGCFDETSMLATCKSVTNIIICQNVMLMTDL